jgi:hypothetical protein
LTDLSVDYLFKMMKHNQSLETLELRGCNFSEEGKEKLKQLKQSKNIEKVFGYSTRVKNKMLIKMVITNYFNIENWNRS